MPLMNLHESVLGRSTPFRFKNINCLVVKQLEQLQFRRQIGSNAHYQLLSQSELNVNSESRLYSRKSVRR